MHVIIGRSDIRVICDHNTISMLFHHRLPSGLRTDSTDFMTEPFLLSISVFVFSFFIRPILFSLVPYSRLSWLFVSFWAHVNIVYRIESYHGGKTAGRYSMKKLRHCPMYPGNRSTVERREYVKMEIHYSSRKTLGN